MKGIQLHHPRDMVADMGGKARIDFIEQILAVVKRPHLAYGLVAHPGDDAADPVQHRVGGAPLVPPVILSQGKLVADRMALAIFAIAHHFPRRCIMLHVVDLGADIDQRLEAGMDRHILDALAIDMDLAAVAQRVPILPAGPDHRQVPIAPPKL